MFPNIGVVPDRRYSADDDAVLNAGLDAATQFRHDQADLAAVTSRRQALAAHDAAQNAQIHEMLQADANHFVAFQGSLALGGALGAVAAVSPAVAFALNGYGVAHGTNSLADGYYSGNKLQLGLGALEAVTSAFGLGAATKALSNTETLAGAAWNPEWTTSSTSLPNGKQTLESIADEVEPPQVAEEFQLLYRGDSTQRTQFLSKLAEAEGVDASNEAIASAERNGGISYLFENHSISSYKSPMISTSSAEEVAQSFARGELGDQAGFVTIFKVPKSIAEPNFENAISWEREYLIPTQIDPKYIVHQYQVKPIGVK